jgi:hypothetical protein
MDRAILDRKRLPFVDRMVGQRLPARRKEKE